MLWTVSIIFAWVRTFEQLGVNVLNSLPLPGFPQALEMMEYLENHEKMFHAWKNHGILKKKLKNHGIL